MKGFKITACICMALAAAMLLFPFYHVRFPSYFERADLTVSGLDLAKKGFGTTEKKMEDAVENIRSLIKDSESLEDLYQSLGKAGSLVTKIRIWVFLALCLPCILLVSAIAAGIAIKGKKGAVLALALDSLAFFVMGAAGIVSMMLFSQWKEKLVNGIKDMKSVSTGISFLDTVLDTASDVVAKNIDKIKLDLRPGWYAFLVLTVAAAVCWSVFLYMHKVSVQNLRSAQGTQPYQPYRDKGDLAPVGSIINHGPMGVRQDAGIRESGNMAHAGSARDMDDAGMDSYAGGQIEDPPTYKSDVRIPDVNGYQGLRAIDPARPFGVLRGLEGIYKNKEINVRQRRLIMGRNPQAATLVFDPSSRKVSRVHCALAFDAERGKYYIKDHSANGVFIYTCENGRYVPRGRLPKDKSCLLQPGTIIDIGSYANRFRLE